MPSLQAAALPLGYAGILSYGDAFTAQVVAHRYAQAADAAIVLSKKPEAMFHAVQLDQNQVYAITSKALGSSIQSGGSCGLRGRSFSGGRPKNT